MSFGSFIRQQREQAGIPMNAFARDIGLSPAYWSRIERDLEKPPKDEWLIASAHKLDLSRDDVFVAAGRLPPDIQEDIAAAVKIYRENESFVVINRAGRSE